jgi:hypothetical protein
MRASPILAVVAGLSLMPGCSWLFVQPLNPSMSTHRNLNCTTNRAAPVIDTIFTTTNVVSALYVAGQDNVANKGQAVMFGLSVAALWAMSAGYGFSKTAECEEAVGSDDDDDDEPDRPPRRRTYRAVPPPSGRYPPSGPSPRPEATLQAPYEPPPAPRAAPPPVAPTATPNADGGASPDAVVAPPPRPAPPAGPPVHQRGDQEEP